MSKVFFKKVYATVFLAIMAFGPFFVSAQVMNSSNFSIDRDSINFGGGLSSSSNFSSETTFGEVGTGRSSSSSYILNAGYQQNEVDTEAPSIPTSLTATAVSTSGIDLSWTASTDNISVLAYRIYRDNVFIATSTLTTYSDTGLTANTTYAYVVSAVDTSYNESARSATSTATTFPTSTTEDTTTGGGGGRILEEPLPNFLNLIIEPDVTEARMFWQSDKFASVQVFWGVNPDAKINSVSNSVYEKNHIAVLKNLIPDTLYHFKIEMTDAFGQVNSLYGQFRTLEGSTEILISPEDQSLPEVTNLEGNSPIVNNVNLTWDNPEVSFDEVVVVRSEDFYPKTVTDGNVLYRGQGESFVDTFVSAEKTYYYTVFVKKGDRYSSGSIIAIRVSKDGKVSDVIKDALRDTKFVGTTDERLKNLTVADFDFIQRGQKISYTDYRVLLDSGVNTTISLDYSKVPEILKTIAVTIKDPFEENKVFTFLLRINKDKTAYVATIGPLEKRGLYNFVIDVLDFKNQGLQKIGGVFVAYKEQIDLGLSWIDFVVVNFWSIFWILVAIILIILILEKERRDRKARQLTYNA